MSAVVAAVAAFAGAFGYVTLNDCDASCYALSRDQGYVGLSYGPTFHHTERLGSELTLKATLPVKFGRVQPVIGISQTDTDDLWYGMGIEYSADFDGEVGGAFWGMSAMTGGYQRGQGQDLDHKVIFRAMLELGYAFDDGARLVIATDHRSNAYRGDSNPGMETIQVRFDLPLGR